MKLVLLGPPGAGKGSLANLLKNELKISHVSTGDILRNEMKNNTEIGKEAKKFIERGALVPDEVVTRLIEKYFASDYDGKGYMLDGFPRTRKQAEDLDGILNSTNNSLDYVIYLDSSLEIVIKRLTGRRICRSCGALFHIINHPPKDVGICDSCAGEVYQRSDDNEETIRNRMDVYTKNTKPIVEYYEAQGKLKRINADKESKELHESLMRIIHEEEKLDKH